MLNQQDGTRLCDALDECANLLAIRISKASQGFIEQKQVAVRRERDRNIKQPLFSVGEVQARGFSTLDQPHSRKDGPCLLIYFVKGVGIGPQLAGPARIRLHRNSDILKGRQVFEQADDLERPTDAEPSPPMGREFRDVLPFELHLSGICKQQSRKDIEERRLAGSVRADDAVKLARMNIQVNVV